MQAKAAQMKSHCVVVGTEACGSTCVTSDPPSLPLLSVVNGDRDLRGCWVVEVIIHGQHVTYGILNN